MVSFSKDFQAGWTSGSGRNQGFRSFSRLCSSSLSTSSFQVWAPVVLSASTPAEGEKVRDRETHRPTGWDTATGSGFSSPQGRQNYFSETFSKPLPVSHWQNQVMCIPEPVSSRMNGIVLQCLRVTLWAEVNSSNWSLPALNGRSGMDSGEATTIPTIITWALLEYRLALLAYRWTLIDWASGVAQWWRYACQRRR